MDITKMYFMKKNLGIILVILYSTIVFGHGTAKSRNKSCNFIRSWQFKAKAAVSRLGWPNQDLKRRCDDIAKAQIDNGCAYQVAINDLGRTQFYGSVYRQNNICARGNIYSELYYDLNDDINDDIGGYENSKITTGDILYENDYVIINNVNGDLLVNGLNLFSSFEVIMWLPLGDIDSLITDEKTFFKGKVELLNGELNVSGDFSKEIFNLSITKKGEYLLEFKNASLKAKLPEGINGKEDLIEVVAISDAGTSENLNILNHLKNDSIYFNVFPNPVVNNIMNISIKEKGVNIDNIINVNELNNKDIFIGKLYDFNGNEIGVLFDNIEKDLLSNYKIDLSKYNLKNGFYFLLVKSQYDIYVTKVIVTN